MTTDSISSISATSAAGKLENTSSTGAKLTQATKAQLEALGVSTANITTETQGQAALTSAKSKAEAGKQAHAPHGNSTESSIKTEAKTLASQVGSSVSDDDKVDDIINKVSAKITDLRASAGDDKTKLAAVDSDQAQLDAISNSLASTKSGQAQLSGSMNGLASMNKVYQNLT